MAEPVPKPKLIVDEDSKPPAGSSSMKVLTLHLKEGGIDLGSFGNPTLLKSDDKTPPGIRAIVQGLQMRFEKPLGGVEIVYIDREQRRRRLLVPLSHIKSMELEP
jgi:hypothetical protein